MSGSAEKSSETSSAPTEGAGDDRAQITHSPGLIAPGSGHYNVLRAVRPAWIAIQLIGEDGSPVAGETYRITLPDGSYSDGTLDAQGGAQVKGFSPGVCKISFPNLDSEAWEEV